MALVSLVDSDRQWFKSRLGLAVCQTPREVSFCAHALSGDRALVVSDATLDPRFADNPLVTGEPGLRFYAGAPLVTGTGYVLGTLCVLDVVPRALSGLQVEHLTALARQVVSQLELRRQAEALASEVGARAAAQATLRESQRLLQGVLDHTDVVVYAKDLDGQYLLANQAHARLLDREDGGVLGCSDYDLFPALAADEFRRHDLQVAASGRREVFAEQVTHLDGTVHGYLSTKFPLRDDTGRVYAVAGVSTDVTELTREREAHAEAEQRWKALVELSPVAVAVLGADGRFAYANPAAAELYGASAAGPLVGRRASDLVPADDDGQVATQFGALLAGGPALLAHRWTLRRLDGTHTTVEVNAAAVTYRGERAVQVELRDVTAQVAAQAALSASEQRFRALFACLPVGAAESLPDGTLLTVNARLCAMLGYTAEELIGQPLNFLLADPADPAEQRSELDALSQTSGYVAERTYRRKDGTGLQVLVGVGVIRDDTGQVHRVLGSIVDVSDRVEAEQALQQAHRDLAARQAFTDAVLDSVDVGIVACDATARLTVFNDATRRWHGVDLMGDNDDAVDPDHFARAFDLHDADGQILTTDQIPLLRALNEGAVHDVEMVISPRDRHATRVLCTGRAMSGPDSQPLGAVVAMSDITAARTDPRAAGQRAALPHHLHQRPDGAGPARPARAGGSGQPGALLASGSHEGRTAPAGPRRRARRTRRPNRRLRPADTSPGRRRNFRHRREAPATLRRHRAVGGAHRHLAPRLRARLESAVAGAGRVRAQGHRGEPDPSGVLRRPDRPSEPHHAARPDQPVARPARPPPGRWTRRDAVPGPQRIQGRQRRLWSQRR